MKRVTIHRAGCLLIGLYCAVAAAAPQSHVGACDQKDAVEKARCQRHEKMFEKCGAIKGPAHHACDREFLLATPLDCKPFTGDAAKRCLAEGEAMQACKAKEGREFVGCVKEKGGESPMGH